MARSEEFIPVGTYYGSVWLGEPEPFDVPVTSDPDELFDSVPPQGLYLKTATHTGKVGISLHLGDEPRPIGDREWEAVGTVSLFLRNPVLSIGGMFGDESFEWDLPEGSGRYFVRAAGRNRVEPPEPLEMPLEQYLIDVWPDRG